jgi:IS30 family transposase
MTGVLNRSLSTISRELRPNGGAQGYASDQARQRCSQRRKADHPAIKLHADALLFDVGCRFQQLRRVSVQVPPAKENL